MGSSLDNTCKSTSNSDKSLLRTLPGGLYTPTNLTMLSSSLTETAKNSNLLNRLLSIIVKGAY